MTPVFGRLATNLALDWRFVTDTSAGIALGERLRYLPRKYAAMVRNRRVVTFLGRPFGYDNRFTPALLQGYPAEIARLDRLVGLAQARTVIDVGANVGQFGFALKSRAPHLDVYSFEPNPGAFALLAVNAARFERWRVFPFGLARAAGVRDFFVVDGKSAQGSIFAENATMNLPAARSRTIAVRMEEPTVGLLDAHGIPRDVDLVKIDVEGAELEVVESLRHVRWRYLFLELSLARAGATTIDAVVDTIEQASGRRPRLVYYQPLDAAA
jgi:FkbM family methyltransferase